MKSMKELLNLFPWKKKALAEEEKAIEAANQAYAEWGPQGMLYEAYMSNLNNMKILANMQMLQQGMNEQSALQKTHAMWQNYEQMYNKWNKFQSLPVPMANDFPDCTLSLMPAVFEMPTATGKTEITEMRIDYPEDRILL